MKFIKTFFRSAAVAFSLYSKIPMPQFKWASDDMKYHLCFFPLVGFVIGLCEIFLKFFCDKFLPGKIFEVCIMLFCPILITGGFHLDGFMDSCDALSSFEGKERKLEILKDAHIGAFSVIFLFAYFLLAAAFLSLAEGKNSALCLAFSFVISRALSGISVELFPRAKKDGMFFIESETSAKKTVCASLFAQLAISFAALFFLLEKNLLFFLAEFFACALSFVIYFFICKKKFGGATGDLAGFFVCLCELFSLIALGSVSFLQKFI